MQRSRVHALQGFYYNLAAYIVINVLLFVINYLISPGFYRFYWVTIFWGLGLVFHAMSVFWKRNLFSKAWKERKILEYMKDEGE